MKFWSLLIALFCAVGGWHFYKKKPESEGTVVAITQIVAHPSLDLIRQGIEETLKEKNIKIVYDNAQGNIAVASQIAQKYRSDKPNIAVGISTPSAQALASGLAGSHIPVVFTAVSNPDSAKLKGPGICDALPMDKYASHIAKVLPVESRRIGILYNPGEVNAVSMMENMKSELAKKGFEVHAVAVLKTSDIATAAQGLVHTVDALFVGNDNLVILGINSLIGLGKPVFCCDRESLDKGCYMACYFDSKDVGRQTGKLILDVLNNPNETYSVRMADDLQYAINSKVAQQYRLPERIADAHE